MKTTNKPARTADSPVLHATLSLDDRDHFDELRDRIEQRAVLLQYTLSTRGGDQDWLSEQDEAILDAGQIALAAEIVVDAGALRGLLDRCAAMHTKGGA